MAKNVYEMKEIRGAWQTENGMGWGFAVETDAGQFVLATDRTWRCVTVGALLMCHMSIPAVRGGPHEWGEIESGERGWEAWVFDRRLNAMAAMEQERSWKMKREREIYEELHIPTDEEVDEVYARLRIPQCVTDVISVFRDCVEVDDAGKPVAGIELPIEAFWANGRFAPVSRERIAKGNWDPQKKRFVGNGY